VIAAIHAFIPTPGSVDDDDAIVVKDLSTAGISDRD
jgi:hypothetical protein